MNVKRNNFITLFNKSGLIFLFFFCLFVYLEFTVYDKKNNKTTKQLHWYPIYGWFMTQSYKIICNAMFLWYLCCISWICINKTCIAVRRSWHIFNNRGHTITWSYRSDRLLSHFLFFDWYIWRYWVLFFFSLFSLLVFISYLDGYFLYFDWVSIRIESDAL